MKTILFQGDSITDCGRNKDYPASLGEGYSTLVASHFSYNNPGAYRFLNRGVSGNKITDLYARRDADIFKLKPDYMSILIGINDVWHEFADNPTQVYTKRFELFYKMLLKETLQELPNIKIVLLEPFTLPCSTTLALGYDLFSTQVKAMAQSVEKIANEFKLPLIKLQEDFLIASKTLGEEYWTQDGIHPTLAGHTLIANKVIDTFKNI